MVHRDLAPRNILFGKEDNKIKIADFGLAKYLGEVGKNEVLLSNYSAHYHMAPEIVRTSVFISKLYNLIYKYYFIFQQSFSKDYGTAPDIFSLGITLLDMLTPRHYWDPIGKILEDAHGKTILPQKLHHKLPKIVSSKELFAKLVLNFKCYLGFMSRKSKNLKLKVCIF